MPEDGDPGDPRDGLPEKLQMFRDYVRADEGQARDIAARPRKAGDEPVRNRIGSTKENNGDGPGRLFGRHGVGCACGEDDINLERNQFCGEGGELLVLPLGISVFNDDIATRDVPEVLSPWRKAS